jgi:septal ring-binding cell division protein DamX
MSTNDGHRVIIPTDLAIPAAPVLESPGGALADAFPISGQIDPKAFPFLVVQLHRRGATGSLKVEGPSYHKALYFRSGRVLFGSSNDPRDQLGAILIESGKITPEQLADVNAKVGPGNPLAKVLADTGFVSQRELSEAARAKVERILSDVLAYTTGKFDFEDGVLPKGAVDLKLATERLVMSAVRRVSDRNFVLRHIDGLDAILGPTAEMVPRLSEIESEAGGLPQHLDGRRTLKEAAAAARLEEFEAAKIASGLLFLGLVERVQAGVRAGAAPMTFADVEAETENELDLGATAAQAFSSEPAIVVPTVEPEPPASPIVTPEPDDEPPPFVIGEAAPAAPATSSSPEIAFPSFSVPEPEPTPAFAATPAYDEPPVIEPAPPSSESPTMAMSAPPVMAAPAAAIPADEPPAPAVTSSASPLPLVMPDKGRPVRPRASSPDPSPAPLREPISSSKQSRPSKEDLAALDQLLNSRSLEGPLTPLDKPGYEERSAPQYPRSGGGRIQRSRAPLFLGVASLLLALAAGGWYYVTRMGGQLPFITKASPAAVTTPLPVAPTTTLAAVAEAPTTVAAVPTTVAAAPVTTLRAAPPSVAPVATPPPVAAATPKPAPPAAADGHALLRAGNYPAAARAFVTSTRLAGKNAAVIQLLIACSTETVQKAIDSGNASELVILPVNFKGRDCYRLAWGIYPSSSKATAALRDVPEYFRNGGATPKVLGSSEVVP